MSKPGHASQSAPVHEYRVLWTAQKKQKLKRWHDGFLRLHTFNNRMVLYDEGRNLVGDKYNKAGETLHEGDELEFEQHLVTIEEFMKTVQQDLTPVFSPAIQRRQQRNAASVQNTPLRVPMGVGDLNTPLRVSTGAMNTPYGVGRGMAPGLIGRTVQYGQPAAQMPMRYPAQGAPQNNAVSRQPPPRAQQIRPQTATPRQGYDNAPRANLPPNRGSLPAPHAPLQHQNVPGMRHMPAQQPAQLPQTAQMANGPRMGYMSRPAPPITAPPTRPPQPPPLTQETPTPAYRPAPKPRSPPPPPLFQPALRAQPPFAPPPPSMQSGTPVRQPRPPPPPQQFQPAPRPRHPPTPQVRPPLAPPQPPIQPETPAQAPPWPVSPPVQKLPTSPAPKPAPPPHPRRRRLPQPTPPPVPERQLVASPDPELEPRPTEAPRPEFRRPTFRPPQRRLPAETTPESAAPTTVAKPDGQPTSRSPPLFKSPPLIPREVILKSVETPESPPPVTTILKLPTATRRTRSKLLCLKRPSGAAATTEAPPKRLKPSTFAEDIEDDESPPSSPKPSGDPWNSQAVDEDWAVDDANMFVGNGDDDGYDNEGAWSREAFCLFDFKRPKVKR